MELLQHNACSCEISFLGAGCVVGGKMRYVVDFGQ